MSGIVATMIWSAVPAVIAVNEGYPIGNGRLGALVCGNPAEERLVLSEGTLYAGGPYDPSNPEALKALPKIRDLIFSGRLREASEMAGKSFMARPLRQMQFQQLGELVAHFDGHEGASGYRRELDLEGAVARVSYLAGNVRYNREYFASAPAGVIVMRVTADKPGHVSFVLGMRSPHAEWRTGTEGAVLVMAGRNGDSEGIKGALAWETRAMVRHTGGTIEARNDRLVLAGADEAVIILAMATSHVSWKDAGGDPRERNLATLAAVEAKPFHALQEEHRADYCALYGRFSLDLGGEEAPGAFLPTPERVASYGEGDADPSLAVLHLNFARYLLISCSRPGGQPANLQGLWVEGLNPPWGSKYTININTEMNYWFAEPANLSECVEPLSAMIHELAEAGKRPARTHYGAPGWVAHHNTDLWRAGGPIDGPIWGIWPMGGAWLCLHLVDRYAFGGDRERLARDYPVLKGAAEFFLASLVIDPNTGSLVTCPSISPENATPAGVSICAGPSMDMSILRALFLGVEEASATLGVDAKLRGKLAAARKRLSPLKVGKAGQLQEWQEDWDMEAPDRTHRHISHLFALHPGSEISPSGTPELSRAARRTLELRGDDGTGWSLAWKINFWARLGEGDRARHLLAMLLTPQRTYPNLFDAHPPFQIDGNYGAANGILEMLVQSHLRTADGRWIIHLLPALPGAWSRGSVAGLRARGGITVDMKWENGTAESARLKGRPGEAVRLRLEGREKDYRLSATGDLRLGTGGEPLP